MNISIDININVYNYIDTVVLQPNCLPYFLEICIEKDQKTKILFHYEKRLSSMILTISQNQFMVRFLTKEVQ